MDKVSEELDMVFELLSMVELGIAYNDGTGRRVKDMTYRVDLNMPQVDGGGIDPFQAVKEEIIDAVRADWQELKDHDVRETTMTLEGIKEIALADDFKVRRATMTRVPVPSQDIYTYVVEITM